MFSEPCLQYIVELFIKLFSRLRQRITGNKIAPCFCTFASLIICLAYKFFNQIIHINIRMPLGFFLFKDYNQITHSKVGANIFQGFLRSIAQIARNNAALHLCAILKKNWFFLGQFISQENSFGKLCLCLLQIINLAAALPVIDGQLRPVHVIINLVVNHLFLLTAPTRIP